MFIKIKVKTGAKTEKVEKKSDDLYFISVKEKAERGMANRRVLGIVRGLFPGRSVKLVKGHHSPAKIVEVLALRSTNEVRAKQ
ncbi:MAG: DUF167 domain-containing protein [Patescibacteria group bacterium]|nr:DUF167 domain-containing protein [Patescibacteria group bacterium]